MRPIYIYLLLLRKSECVMHINLWDINNYACHLHRSARDMEERWHGGGRIDELIEFHVCRLINYQLR